jgi:hypothetical protein
VDAGLGGGLRNAMDKTIGRRRHRDPGIGEQAPHLIRPRHVDMLGTQPQPCRSSERFLRAVAQRHVEVAGVGEHLRQAQAEAAGAEDHHRVVTLSRHDRPPAQ